MTKEKKKMMMAMMTVLFLECFISGNSPTREIGTKKERSHLRFRIQVPCDHKYMRSKHSWSFTLSPVKPMSTSVRPSSLAAVNVDA